MSKHLGPVTDSVKSLRLLPSVQTHTGAHQSRLQQLPLDLPWAQSDWRANIITSI